MRSMDFKVRSRSQRARLIWDGGNNISSLRSYQLFAFRAALASGSRTQVSPPCFGTSSMNLDNGCKYLTSFYFILLTTGLCDQISRNRQIGTLVFILKKKWTLLRSAHSRRIQKDWSTSFYYPILCSERNTPSISF